MNLSHQHVAVSELVAQALLLLQPVVGDVGVVADVMADAPRLVSERREGDVRRVVFSGLSTLPHFSIP